MGADLNSLLRALPSVDEVLARLAHLAETCPRRLLVDEVRRAIEYARAEIRSGELGGAAIEARVEESIAMLARPSLRRVINATGVILHTNLGRAPLARFEQIPGYSNLEYDVEAGRRGRRDVHTADLLERLLDAPAIAVNNNAAAVYLVLKELAEGGEVIVSRGELIEIGDGFRIPEIMEQSGAELREVGTTNRTRIEDYRNAIDENTRLLLRVHPSNFSIRGFTAKPELAELAALSREARVPLYEDLGSGCLTDLSAFGVTEPLASESLAAGADLVSFSGDKLLGGPQAGLIAGREDLVSRLRRNPIYRALRLDKLIYQALEATLRELLFERWDRIPALRMIRLSKDEVRRRAEGLLAAHPEIRGEVIDGESLIGGGSTPDQSLPTCLIAIAADRPSEFERRLRAADPPVIARIEGNTVLIDLRTVFPEEEAALANSLAAAFE